MEEFRSIRFNTSVFYSEIAFIIFWIKLCQAVYGISNISKCDISLAPSLYFRKKLRFAFFVANLFMTFSMVLFIFIVEDIFLNVNVLKNSYSNINYLCVLFITKGKILG